MDHLAQLRQDLLTLVLEGDVEAGLRWAHQALAAGHAPLALFEGCVTPVLNEVGERFQRLDIFLPELLQCADVTQALMAREITPALRAGRQQHTTRGKVVIGTVLGDIHDIGKNMVVLMLELNGFDVTDLGADVPPSDFIETARKQAADIIALSAILTTSLPHMANVVQLLDGFHLRHQFKVVIGGAATTQAFAEQIGVEGYGRDAAAAVDLCRRLCATHLPIA